jgi:hypothetical protein
MARARNIKPGFYKNEDLAECSIWARFIFPGLWMLADRDGRLEDRPKRIKGELLPFDGQDVEPLLAELQARGFLVRYQNSAGSFIQITKFSNHQTPHYSEKASVIKPHDFQESPPHDGGNTPGTPQENSRKAPVLKGGSQPPDSLNPDSPNPEGIQPASQAPARPTDERPPLTLVAESKGPPDCPHRDVLLLWAEVLPHLPQHDPDRWRGARADNLRVRWRETAVAKGWRTPADGLAYLRKLFAWIARSAFLNGRAAQPGKRPFVLELEWLVERANWDRVIEGKYHEEATA